ncbi:VWA domain-containing protein [Hyphomicrobium methylovorum]|uniref:vWA domain-containing protein n=1 Tax=Hyphomicrobium methylovorum TaxID=84 RepID=UPI0015E6E39B|nr:vWA domain-containing protein [Hyphomicrobium methylovorum]MBA2125307.1 VWA domain-containing protein [Hyphomicrobium methylovorum]
MIFTNPLALYLLPLALIPLFLSGQKQDGFPSLAGIEIDRLSQAIDIGLRLLGVLAITGLILGVAGISLRERSIDRFGQGAHIVLLIDRSSSMDDTFAGRQPSGAEESKSAAAKRLLKEFVKERANDRFGIAAFSTAPIHIAPITDHKDLVLGAIDAIDRRGLSFTDIGRGLGMGLDMMAADVSQASRAIVLVSDGAGVIGRRVQESLRTEFARLPVHLYWLYLRTEGTNGIFEVPPPGAEDTPQVLPERHLNKFFESLKVPYRAFEAESPEAVKTAITEIGKLEQTPIVYSERIPQYDLSRWAYALAALALGGLLAAKLCERSLGRSQDGTHAA